MYMYIEIMKIDHGGLEKKSLKIFYRSLDWYKSYDVIMFDLDHWYDLNNQCIQSLSTGYAHVQISGLHYEVNCSYAF